MFALSNPTEQAEVSFEDALAWTGGAAVFASGSPFPPITTQQPGGRLKTLRPAQANNCFVFPGLAQGVLAGGVRRVDERLLLAAAEVIAGEGLVVHVCAGRPSSSIGLWYVSPQIALWIGVTWAWRHNTVGLSRVQQTATPTIMFALLRPLLRVQAC